MCTVTLPYLYFTDVYRAKDEREILFYSGMTGRYCHDIVMEQDGAKHERYDMVREDRIEWCTYQRPKTDVLFVVSYVKYLFS